MTTPRTWAALTAYATGAYVRATASATPMYRATVGGTSGASEPSWPGPGLTVVDGSVTWTFVDAWRQEARAAILLSLADLQTANPGLFPGLFAVRPPSYSSSELPCIHPLTMDEEIRVYGGVIQRNPKTLALRIVDVVPDNAEAEGRMDALVDILVNWFALVPHVVSGNSVVVPVGVEADATGDVDENGLHFLSNVLVLEGAVAMGTP